MPVKLSAPLLLKVLTNFMFFFIVTGGPGSITLWIERI
jgi:hypothetical protein